MNFDLESMDRFGWLTSEPGRSEPEIGEKTGSSVTNIFQMRRNYYLA